MNQFTFSIEQANNQYVQIKAVISTKEEVTVVQLPSWRPGRYELGNFAKNVRNFKVLSSENRQLASKKISKDSWEVDTRDHDTITVT